MICGDKSDEDIPEKVAVTELRRMRFWRGNSIHVLKVEASIRNVLAGIENKARRGGHR